jgi:hypothetical protein
LGGSDDPGLTFRLRSHNSMMKNYELNLNRKMKLIPIPVAISNRDEYLLTSASGFPSELIVEGFDNYGIIVQYLDDVASDYYIIKI